jgi:signal peptidase I
MAASLPADAWLPSYADILRRWLAEGRLARLPLSGLSMEPTISSGVHLVLEACAPDAIRAGDVVVYEDASGLICHRVLRRRPAADAPALLTKGDGLRVPPAWVSATSVVGRVVAIESPEGRRSLTAPRERWRTYAAMARSWLALLARAAIGAMRRSALAARPA